MYLDEAESGGEVGRDRGKRRCGGKIWKWGKKGATKDVEAEKKDKVEGI